MNFHTDGDDGKIKRNRMFGRQKHDLLLMVTFRCVCVAAFVCETNQTTENIGLISIQRSNHADKKKTRTLRPFENITSNRCLANSQTPLKSRTNRWRRRWSNGKTVERVCQYNPHAECERVVCSRHSIALSAARYEYV